MNLKLIFYHVNNCLNSVINLIRISGSRIDGDIRDDDIEGPPDIENQNGGQQEAVFSDEEADPVVKTERDTAHKGKSTLLGCMTTIEDSELPYVRRTQCVIEIHKICILDVLRY